MILKLKDGDVKIELFNDVAPNHVKRIKELADSGKYDNVVFHRVIDGFMAQTGDVKFGNSNSDIFDATPAKVIDTFALAPLAERVRYPNSFALDTTLSRCCAVSKNISFASILV